LEILVSKLQFYQAAVVSTKTAALVFIPGCNFPYCRIASTGNHIFIWFFTAWKLSNLLPLTLNKLEILAGLFVADLCPDAENTTDGVVFLACAECYFTTQHSS